MIPFAKEDRSTEGDHLAVSKPARLGILAVACTLFLLLKACGGDRPDIDQFSITPQPIPAPQVGTPVQFKVQVRISAPAGTAYAIHPEPTGYYLLLLISDCGACNGALIEISCKSEQDPLDAADLRTLSCIDPKATTSAQGVQKIKVKAGTANWLLSAWDPARPGKDPTALILPGDRRVTTPITIQ